MLKKLRVLISPLVGTPTSAGNRPPRRFVPGLECLEERAVPASFSVTTTLDVVNPNDGKLSLREAISAANAHTGADTIILPAGVYRLALTGADDANAAGDLDVTGSTLFQGSGAGNTVIDGQQIDRVFDVRGTAPSSIKVTFQNLTIRNGLADAGGGGGIRVGKADLTVQDCVVTGNRTSGFGGGISNAALPGTGNVTLVRSTIDHNVAALGGGLSVQADGQGQGSVLNVNASTIQRNLSSGSGGGIFAGVATLTNSTVRGNSSSRNGGGIFAENTVKLTGSAVSGNTATEGGGIDAGTAMLTNSTVSGNHATNGNGGGIKAITATLTSSTISGNSAGRSGGGIFVTTTATLTKSKVSGNSAGIDSGGIEAFTATLTSSTVSGNHANGDGGGIFASTVTLTTSTFSGNHANGEGGGIETGTAILTNSTVNGNSAGDEGGGIDADRATLTNSTVSGNHANGDGGGIDADRATLTNSTVSGNSAGVHGGGIQARDLTLLNVTITDNSAHTGGGAFLSTDGTSSVRNSIIAENLNELDGDGPDVFGAFTSGGHNLIGDGSGATGFTNGTNRDQVGTAVNPIDPRLGPLANNGGPTKTHALLAGSPAIDRGDNTGAPATDQRGVGRPRDGDRNGSRIIDIGAFER
jgi:predicted outer membrane repeat protein